MHKIALFGATGHLGRHIALEARKRGYETSLVVRDIDKARKIFPKTSGFIQCDINNKGSVAKICQTHNTIISALGKSVSFNDQSKESFRDIDLNINASILREAVKAGVQKFVYISALHSERYPDLVYFRAHHEFSELLIASGIDYSIIKPPSLFSAYHDTIPMALKGQLFNIGKGDHKTNPVWDGDVAQVCLDSLTKKNHIHETGGVEVMTRKEILQIIQSEACREKKVKNFPAGLLTLLLPVIKMIDLNTYDKLAFITSVLKEDTIGPREGSKRLREYIREHLSESKTLKNN
jgi:uncharacterized protein YbjT (DUF2867 family)